MINFKKKEDELIVSQKEINEEVKKIKKEEKSAQDDEPSWYHYFIIIFGTIGVFLLVVFLFSFYYDSSNINNSSSLYTYDYSRGNITYKIYFNSPVSQIKDFDYIVEPERLDLLNTVSFKISLMNYTGDSNSHVGLSSSKLLSFLKRLYHFNFEIEDIVNYDLINCNNSTLRDKIIIFDVNSTKIGVFYNSQNGCIEFMTNDSKDIPNLVDKFMYEIIQEEIEYDNQ